MGMYQGKFLNSGPEPREPRRNAGERGSSWAAPRRAGTAGASRAGWREVRSSVPRAPRRGGGSWLDAMLGEGSSNKLEPLRRAWKREAPKAAPAPAARVRVEMRGKEEPGDRKRRGVIRLVLGGCLALWVLASLHPGRKAGWLARQARKRGAWLVALFKAPAAGPQAGVAEAQRVAQGDAPTELASASPAPTPQGTPVAALGGAAVALVQSGDGRWYRMDAQGRVQLSSGPDDPQNMDLPVVVGMPVQNLVQGGRWVKALDFQGASLAGLFPLRPMLLTEVTTVDLSNPANPKVVTHEGTTAWLGQGDFGVKERHLGLVLRDLAAKGKLASLIDMRFQGSAVVTLAGRRQELRARS